MNSAGGKRVPSRATNRPLTVLALLLGLLLPPALRGRCAFADRCQVDDELLLPVEAQKGIEGLLIVRRNRARPRPDRFGGKVQVLADVADIHREDAVRGGPVPPLHPVRDDAPEERDDSLPDEPLTETGLGDMRGQPLFRELE
jgi:hypothetical protein